MIREDNVTLQTLREDLAGERLTLKEYVMRKEGSALLSTAINKHLLTAYKSYPSVRGQVFTTITKGDGEGSDVRFPNMAGCNPQYIPELSEVPFDNLDITSTTVSAEKFGLRMGISQEMVDDNEVSLIGWVTSRVGVKMAELQDQEAFKALDTFFSTGALLNNGNVVTWMGNKDRGKYYTTGTLTNGCTASGTGSWEDIINTALAVMKGQQITLQGQTYKYPVYVDTIVVPIYKELGVRKVVNTTMTVSYLGIAATTAAADMSKVNLPGNNVFNGILKVVASPFVGRGLAYILQAGRGLVFLEREAIRVDRQANWAFEAEEIKAITRFMPAVVEERSIFGIITTTA